MRNRNKKKEAIKTEKSIIKPDNSRQKTVALFNEETAAKYIGMSRSFLRQSRMTGDLRNRTPAPPFVKFGRTVRYRVDDLDKWMNDHFEDRHPPKDMWL